MVEPKATLIVAKSGPLREGLRAALNAMPCVVVIGEADAPASALEIELDEAPALIVLSADTPGQNALDAWQQIQARWPGARSIILADTVREQKMARAVVADPVLLKGSAARKLFAAVETLFHEMGEGDSSWGLPQGEG